MLTPQDIKNIQEIQRRSKSIENNIEILKEGLQVASTELKEYIKDQEWWDNKIITIQSLLYKHIIKALISAISFIPVAGFPASLILTGLQTGALSSTLALSVWDPNSKSIRINTPDGETDYIKVTPGVRGYDNSSHMSTVKAHNKGVPIVDSMYKDTLTEAKKNVENFLNSEQNNHEFDEIPDFKIDHTEASRDQKEYLRTLQQLDDRISKMVQNKDEILYPLAYSSLTVNTPDEPEFRAIGTHKKGQYDKVNWDNTGFERSRGGPRSKTVTRFKKDKWITSRQKYIAKEAEYEEHEKGQIDATITALLQYENKMSNNVVFSRHKMSHFMKDKTILAKQGLPNSRFIMPSCHNLIKKAFNSATQHFHPSYSKTKNEQVQSRFAISLFIMHRMFELHLGTPIPDTAIFNKKNKYRFFGALEDMVFLSMVHSGLRKSEHYKSDVEIVRTIDLDDSMMISVVRDYLGSAYMMREVTPEAWSNIVKRATERAKNWSKKIWSKHPFHNTEILTTNTNLPRTPEHVTQYMKNNMVDDRLSRSASLTSSNPIDQNTVATRKTIPKKPISRYKRTPHRGSMNIPMFDPLTNPDQTVEAIKLVNDHQVQIVLMSMYNSIQKLSGQITPRSRPRKQPKNSTHPANYHLDGDMLFPYIK